MRLSGRNGFQWGWTQTPEDKPFSRCPFWHQHSIIRFIILP